MMLRCTRILLALFLAGFSYQAAAQTAGVDIPPYPGAEVHRMGDRSLVNDAEYRVYYFTTSATPHQVATYYQKRWVEAGHVVAVSRTGQQGMAVAYLDLRTGETRSVSAWRDGKLTYGFPAVVKGVALPFARTQSVAGHVPLHPSAEGLVTNRSLERGAAFLTVSYSDRASLKQNESFFLKEMGQRGWQLVSRNVSQETKNTAMLEFARQVEKMSVTLVWVPERQRTSVFVVTTPPREDQP
jgi:hypothetical protein